GSDVEAAARALAEAAVRHVDLGRHAGAHPRSGVVDVVPFVPLEGSTMADAVSTRDRFASWAGDALGVPCFLYGPERSLPEVGPAEAYDAVAREAAAAGTEIARAELVGLAPEATLDAIPEKRWSQLGLSRAKTIEVALRKAGV